jgi:hypothetical protein
VAFLYLNFNKTTLETPWVVSETNKNRTQMISQKCASELEINVPCKTFVGKFHYFACQGEVVWDGTKAIIEPTTSQHQPLVEG